MPFAKATKKGGEEIKERMESSKRWEEKERMREITRRPTKRRSGICRGREILERIKEE